MQDFISFSLGYFRKRIQYYETTSLSAQELYEARQLLKMTDDLTDEGYTELSAALEQEGLLPRLRAVLARCHAVPFPLPELHKKPSVYRSGSMELRSTLQNLYNEAVRSQGRSDKELLKDLKGFCNWIGYEEGTAYIFLLRDALLPYLYYLHRNREHLYPWLIGRRFLTVLGEEGLDDSFRQPIFNAVNAGIPDFPALVEYCRPTVLDALSDAPAVEEVLRRLLCSIQQDRIIVVESGCYGTFPILLACLDPRVEVRMFTAVPYLQKIYGERIYTGAYEKNRDFETLASQNHLIRLSGVENGCFRVQQNADPETRKEALAEIHTLID